MSEIHKTLKNGKNVFLHFNRRGFSRCLACKDCQEYVSCDFCDIPFVVHERPIKKLLCHHCSLEKTIPLRCQLCHGTNLEAFGIGIQKIESSLEKAFEWITIVRIDSDTKRKTLATTSDTPHIIVGTELAASYSFVSLGLVGFVSAESELSVSDYAAEEQFYTHVARFFRFDIPIIIQTYLPKSPIITLITQGNFREFVIYALRERKTFGFPPYEDLLHIYCQDANSIKLQDRIFKLASKLEHAKRETTELFFDKGHFERFQGAYVQKIVLKGKNLIQELDIVRPEILRNRGTWVEWK